MKLSRRSVLQGAMAAAGGAAVMGWSSAMAQRRRQLNILAVPVHAEILRNGPGGNVAGDWESANNTQIEWLTFANGPLAERTFRELSLRSSNVGLGFFYDPWASPNILNMLEPLDVLMAENPIEDFDDFFAGPVGHYRHEGHLYGLPIRQNVAGLHYNEAYFEERGLTRPPQTMEEVIEYAERLTYTREDGTPVVGFALPNRQSNYSHFIRGWNADFVDEEYVVRADEPAMIASITALHEMYRAGSLPRQFSTLSEEDNINWIQTGRAAMTFTTTSKLPVHNDPKQSAFPGKIKVAPIPPVEALKEQFPVAPVALNFWSLVIPANSTNKELAWEFIRFAASKENTLRLAQNGNGPMRSSAYEDAAYIESVPYASIEKEALQVARVALPAFKGAARAADAISEECEAAVIGVKTPEEAMTSLAAQLRRLVSA
ncbi:extracellular solute-binding protein [Pseudochelatococcus sp. B33]